MTDGDDTAERRAPGTPSDRLRPTVCTIGWSQPERDWTRHASAVAAAAAIGTVVLMATFKHTLGDWSSVHAILTIVGIGLVIYALIRALVAIFGPKPLRMAADKHTAWRIAWSLGALSLTIVVLTHVMFGLNDHMRAAERAQRFCHEPAPAPPAPGTPVESGDPGADLAEEPTTAEAFGFDRGVQSTSFVVAVVDGPVQNLTSDDFRVLSDDGRAVKSFARVESVTPLSVRQALVRLEIDLSCHAGMEGGEFGVRTIYLPTATTKPVLDHQSWHVDVTLQSRLLFYFLALVPVIVVGAIFQVFSMWPSSLKRWFTSVVAIVLPVLTAYRVAGLNNATWHQDPLTVAALLGATYAAAVTAANLVKNGGHDLGQPDAAPGAGSPAVPDAPPPPAPASTTAAVAANGHDPVATPVG